MGLISQISDAAKERVLEESSNEMPWNRPEFSSEEIGMRSNPRAFEAENIPAFKKIIPVFSDTNGSISSLAM